MPEDLTSLLKDLTKLAERAKRLDPPFTVPPHRPELIQREKSIVENTFFRANFGRPFAIENEIESEFERGGGEIRGEAAEAEKREKEERERREANRAAARAERDQRIAALAGDLAAIRSQMGDAQFLQLTQDCWLSAGGGAIIGGANGALAVLMGSTECRKMFIESYLRIVNNMRSSADALRERIERDRFERMDRNHYDAERFDLLSRTA